MWTMSDVCGDNCGPVSYPMSVSVPSVGGGDGKRVGMSGSKYPHDSNMSQTVSGAVLHAIGLSGREHITRAAVWYNGSLIPSSPSARTDPLSSTLPSPHSSSETCLPPPPSWAGALVRQSASNSCQRSLGPAAVLLTGKLEDTLARPLQPRGEQAGLDCNETASSRLQGEATP